MPGEIVLIIEDDPTLLRGLKDNFEHEGYKVVTAVDGEIGLELALDINPSLILLDIMLPKINGYEICRLIRKQGLDVPIIMLTAKGQESDIVLGLDLGADDYVTKPFSIRELLSRSNAFLRRRRTATPEVYHFGDCTLDIRSQSFFRDGREVELTPKEFRVLELFLSRPGRAITRDDILRSVWGYSVFVTQRSVDRCINTLRGKIEPNAAKPTLIKTIRQIGYRFDLPTE